jgi:asparagine synthetase B (glutamine-hydrolysing)
LRHEVARRRMMRERYRKKGHRLGSSWERVLWRLKFRRSMMKIMLRLRLRRHLWRLRVRRSMMKIMLRLSHWKRLLRR